MMQKKTVKSDIFCKNSDKNVIKIQKVTVKT